MASEDPMAKYAVFFTLTGQTVKAFMDKPSDRAATVGRLCEQAGGRMDAYYLMFGAWDGLVIFEVPDSNAAAAVSLAVSSTGSFQHLETHELVEASDIEGVLRSASALTYSPPGA
jgi:uncharacterized protein with GYD domain